MIYLHPNAPHAFRLPLQRDLPIRELRLAIETGEVAPEIAPYVRLAAHCSRRDLERAGWRAALDP